MILALFRHATSQSRIPPSKQDMKLSLLQSIECWLFHHSIEPDGSELEMRNQLAHKPRHQHSRQWSQVQNKIIQPCQQQKSNNINLIEFTHHSYKSIERDHHSKHLQWTEWPYPWMRPYWESSWSQRRFPSQYCYNFISSNWAKCTYLSLGVDL
jgi:hypothetical protein